MMNLETNHLETIFVITDPGKKHQGILKLMGASVVKKGFLYS